MKKRVSEVLVAVSLAAGVAGCGSAHDGRIQASGTVEATEADLGFQVPGRVLEVTVREGDLVSGGQDLARLDQTELAAGRAAAAAQLEGARARLAELRRGARIEEIRQAEAVVRSARQRADNARRDVDRARRLFEGGAISQQALDQAETAVEVTDAAAAQADEALALVRQGPRTETIEAQVARVEQAEADLDRASAALDYAGIRAPFPGRITIRHREPGEAVSPGAPVLTLLDPTDRWVRIYVREDQIGRVQIGMAAEIVSDTYPERAYRGEVIFIGSEAEFTPRNVQTTEERTKLVYPVKVRIIDDRDFDLKPGIPADVTLLESGS
ncbi:MAG: HlyD family efflux transporter periplasmic adaptor subunit [Gemmatimonadota bacterium]|jgi:HlyD family secretion protein